MSLVAFFCLVVVQSRTSARFYPAQTVAHHARMKHKTPPELIFSASLQPAEDGQPRRFSGVAYTGEVIKNHWAWEDLVFDLASMTFLEKCPVLIGHDFKQRAGVVDTFSVDNERGLLVSGFLMDTEAGRSVANEADAGFPWQMSVHIEPVSVERRAKGTVNGRVFDTPVTVFMGGAIREVSFTPTGADKNTSAQVFNHQPSHLLGESMTIEELQAQLATLTEENDALKAKFAAAQLAERVEKFSTTFGDAPSADEQAVIADMSALQFGLLLKKHDAPKPNLPEHLFSEHANRGATPSAMPLADYVKLTFTA